MGLKGTNQEFGRPYNRRIVLELIRRFGPISRSAIAGQVGLTVQTVSNITRELEDQGFVMARKTAPKGRGYPATDLMLNPEGGFAIGINISPKGLGAALINLAGEIVEIRQLAHDHPEPQPTLKTVLDIVDDFRRQLAGRRVLGIGLAMPGPLDVESMSFVGPTTLEGWKGVHVQREISQGTSLPVYIETDHTAAAIGEQLYGVGRNLRDFYHLYVGVGLGGAMISDGQPQRGARRNAGEIGHLPLVPGGLACACGNRGCLERYLSLEAADRRSADIGQTAWVEEAGALLRAAVIAIENLYDPETVVIGGLAPQSMLRALLEAAQPLGNSVAARTDRRHPRIILSDSGPNAVLRGAAALAVSGILSPRFGVMFAGEGEEPEADPIFGRSEAA